MLYAELTAVGAVLSALGFGVRLISIPLIFTLILATVTVHWQRGWLAS